MSFRSGRILMKVTLLCTVLAPSGFSSTEIWGDESHLSQAKTTKFLTSPSKGASSLLLTNETLRSLAVTFPTSPKKNRFASKLKILSPKKNPVRVLTKQRTLESCWIPSTDASSQKTSVNSVTIDEGNKENVLPLSFQVSSEEGKKKEIELKKQQAQFMALFQQPSKVNNKAIKQKFIKKIWPISKSGNPYLQISSSESPDRKEHYIVIVQSVSQYTGKTEYSACIDGQPYSKFQPLGCAWFPDHDSVKRASLTIIYK